MQTEAYSGKFTAHQLCIGLGISVHQYAVAEIASYRIYLNGKKE